MKEETQSAMLWRLFSVLLILLANGVHGAWLPRRNGQLDDKTAIAAGVSDEGNPKVADDAAGIPPEQVNSTSATDEYSVTGNVSTTDHCIHESDDDTGLQHGSSHAGTLTLHEQQIVTVYQKASQSSATVFAIDHRSRFWGIEKYSQSHGSGVLWDESGHVVTAYHVVYDKDNGRASSSVFVCFDESVANENLVEAIIVGADKTLDIAVLRLLDLTLAPSKLPNVPSLDVGNSSQVHIGQTVMAIGHPVGTTKYLTIGVVSAKEQCDFSNDKLARGVADAVSCIVIDASLKSGFSGGSLLDSQGQLIGILVGSLEKQTLGIAVAIDPVAAFVNGLLNEPDEGFRIENGPSTRKKWWNRLLGKK